MKLNKESILKCIAEKTDRPLTMKSLIARLAIPPEQRPRFRRLVKEMSRGGEIIKIKGTLYGLPVKMNLVTGVFQAHAKGYGFVLSEIRGNDIYVSFRNTSGAMHGDKVVCRVESKKRDGSREGRIIRIPERAFITVTGIYESGKSSGFVIPLDRHIPYDLSIPVRFSMKAKTGQSVVAEISRYPESGRNPEGKIIEILGDPDNPDVEIEMTLRKYGIPSAFPESVEREAKKIKQRVSQKEITRRLDLRDTMIITIDGETAKDFDDAVSIEKKQDGGYRLGVHIADVSYYVQPDSVLDREACKRGTSVYFPNRVVPMLPFELSDNVCSLKPGEERLTMSAFLDIDGNGNTMSVKFAESVIRSRERMTYTDVARLLEKNERGIKARYNHLLESLSLIKNLALLLYEKRRSEGSIDFDFPEPEIILDLRGRPENIVRSERNIAHKIIEECMLAANRAVAEKLWKQKLPAIYRIHDKPDTEKVEEFGEFVRGFGYTLQKGALKPIHFQRLLDKARGKPEEKLITTLMLRHMKQARYSCENTGHFGLGFDLYTHFTSPIRRYPDLIVHRLLKRALKSPKGSPDTGHWVDRLPEIAEGSSVTERRAEKAERDFMDLKKIQFMEDKIGEEYTGVISGVTSFGLFVELDELFVEGLVHVSGMGDDYYLFDEKNHSLIGERKKRVYRIGDPVTVSVGNVSTEKRRIDFILCR